MKAFERLIRYAGFSTAAFEASEAHPSNPLQLEFGRFLVDELRLFGINDASIDKNGYVFGTIESNTATKCPVLGLIAHMDVVADVPYENIKPSVVSNYKGGDILLNREKSIAMSPSEYETLKRYIGYDLVVTDGTTLLGADDKAGIAEIMTFAEHLLSHPEIPHGKIRIGFTPADRGGLARRRGFV
jgi:tripeptide aminopeptidase